MEHTNISDQAFSLKTGLRDSTELLYNRTSLLNGKDKLLMTMYLKNGISFRQMARLTGVNEASIARRIHKITKRLVDGEYITCLRNRDKFTAVELDIAKDYFLRGLSIRKTAKERGLTYYRVRQTIKRIQRFVGLLRDESSRQDHNK